MKHIFSGARLFSLLLVAGFLFSGCVNEPAPEPLPETEAPVTSEVLPETTLPETEAPAEPVNYLTGEPIPEENTNRPAAVMVNNLKGSLPQYGISDADIIFELPVESGITRLMAVYSDYTRVPEICSVRSARYYFPLLAAGMDAVYLHWGLDQSVCKEVLESKPIDSFDGGTVGAPLFYRDKDRTGIYAIEHTGAVNGPVLPEVLSQKGIRTERKETHQRAVFSFLKEPAPAAGDSAETVAVGFSKGYYSTFAFEGGVYKKQHSGVAHKDSRTGKQLEFTNLLILQTNTGILREGTPLVEIDLSGGTGYYCSGGSYEPILWSRESELAPISLSKADGTPLSISPGKSYIGILDYNQTVSIS